MESRQTITGHTSKIIAQGQAFPSTVCVVYDVWCTIENITEMQLQVRSTMKFIADQDDKYLYPIFQHETAG